MLAPPRVNANRGFSLVEITLALGIVSFCVIAVLGLSVLTLDQTRESKRDVIWINLAEEVATKLKAAAWNTSALAAQEFYFDTDGKTVASTSTDAIYTCKATEVVGDLPGTPTGSSPYKKTIRLEMGMKTSKDKLVIPLLLSKYD